MSEHETGSAIRALSATELDLVSGGAEPAGSPMICGGGGCGEGRSEPRPRDKVRFGLG
jgi:hypothetical protein